MGNNKRPYTRPVLRVLSNDTSDPSKVVLEWDSSEGLLLNWLIEEIEEYNDTMEDILNAKEEDVEGLSSVLGFEATDILFVAILLWLQTSQSCHRASDKLAQARSRPLPDLIFKLMKALESSPVHIYADSVRDELMMKLERDVAKMKASRDAN
jgi:hypothetical protein